ncbi:uncharacterized protein [Ptychodera flava]|uniref:uncharacterized protein n=1 Tax=Ptychodera flava TaxID=63121 RepID=UPI00396A7C81
MAENRKEPKQTRPDEQLVEDCKAQCSELGKERNMVYSAANGMPTAPQIAERKTIYEEIGSGVAMVCPRGGVGIPVLWEKDREALSAKSLKQNSEGRMSIDGTNTLHIHELVASDSALYSCWFENRLLATVRIVVNKPVIIDKGVGSYVVYIVLTIVLVLAGSVAAAAFKTWRERKTAQ